MKKVGIMGGTFNPIHMGHLILAEKAREQFHLDNILFIPCGMPYMKDCKEVLPGEVRAEMTRLATMDNPFFDVSMMEIDKKGRTYTYETLQELHEKNPNTEYYFILGADSLWAVENWKEPQKIFDSCTMLTAAREDKNTQEINEKIAFLTKKYQADIFLLDTPQLAISSSMIRDAIKSGNSIRYYVPEAVYDYIIKNKLYKIEETI